MNNCINLTGRIVENPENSRKFYTIQCDKWYLLNSADGSDADMPEYEENTK